MRDKKLVLVVDDDETMRYSLDRYLRKRGFEVKTVENGFDVLLMCLYLIPDLIISDIRMPKLDGITLLKGLKNNQDTRGIPVIFMSAYASDDVMEEARELGARYFLIKPFPYDNLEELLIKAVPDLAEKNEMPGEEWSG